MRRYFRDERGQVLIFFAALLPIAVAMLGFAVDIGRLQLARVQLQTAVDAASLAGASTARVIIEGDSWGNIYNKYIRMDEATAWQAAYDCLITNVQQIPQATLVFCHIEPKASEGTVEVQATIRIPTYFFGIAGRSYLETSRIARAMAKMN